MTHYCSTRGGVVIITIIIIIIITVIDLLRTRKALNAQSLYKEGIFIFFNLVTIITPDRPGEETTYLYVQYNIYYMYDLLYKPIWPALGNRRCAVKVP